MDLCKGDLERSSLRQTDSNSLLRMYDLAKALFNKSSLRTEREKAEKAMNCIAQELEKRHVPL